MLCVCHITPAQNGSAALFFCQVEAEGHSPRWVVRNCIRFI